MAADIDRTTRIAGKLTAEDWSAFKAILVVGGDARLWGQAFENYLWQRLQLRYLHPIRLLQLNGTWEGEGFSILSIQCALIEFLAALRKGQNYRHIKRGENLGAHEYSKSGKLFVEFLSTTKTFDTWFPSDVAEDFYSSIRCALLHEARTKNGWIIWGTGACPIDAGRKIVYRDTLQCVILDYIEAYRQSLRGDLSLQEAFFRKFESLAI
ncbi:hypothetical protein [Pleomorphomonas koreensis]|uniref:hypothetical protein n=1 Tax=Pleomorphomonas koreensis TaxID=257440 RepID=UPI00047977A2|nr:hypothetical protein [Pleomorphomonas koreensis]